MKLLKQYRYFLAAFDAMNHHLSFDIGRKIYNKIISSETSTDQELAILYNMAGHFIDIGQEDSNDEASILGVKILEA